MTVEQRLDDYLSGQDKAELDNEIDKIVEDGVLGPFRLAGVKRKGEGYTVYLDPSNPSWECTVCGGGGENTYGFKPGSIVAPCYFCGGDGFITDPKKLQKMPNLIQFAPGGGNG